MAVIGIDLGTTNSLAAVWTSTGPALIPNALGTYLTPSVVSVDENGDILVGDIAKERLISHPHVTASAFKRFMGTKKQFHLGTYTFVPEELSSFILRSLKEDAEVYLGEQVQEAVISVPAYFNDAQRKSTKHAAELAGLKVERLISEPTAAALAYGLDKMDSEMKFLVFDLGGGTFDVSILELFEGIVEVKSISGDNFLGGEDFTEVLVSYFITSMGIDDASIDSKIRSAIYKQAELCKCALSQCDSGKISIVADDRNLELNIERTDFDQLVSQLLVRISNPVERALRDASLSPEDLNAVVLIGGATRMQVVRSTAAKIFKRLPYSNINPDEAVALGTAVQVALKERNEALNELILTDVCPYTLGTQVSRQRARGKFENGYYMPIIERNTSVPVSRVERFYTLIDNQSAIKVDIYQGESRRVEDNILLGDLNVQIPPAPAGEQSIDIRYTYDINGILEVEVVTVKTGSMKRMVIENSPHNMSEEEVERRLKALENIKIHPRERTANRLLIARGERLYQELLGDGRAYIANRIAHFEYVLSLQNEKNIEQAAEAFKLELEELERMVDSQ